MAVLKNDRNESSAEFVRNARRLYIFTMDRCAHFPKRYTFILSVKMCNLAEEIYDNVKRANSYPYPFKVKEIASREMYFLKTIELLDSLVGHISIAREKFSISDALMEEWIEYIDSEYRLIRGVMKSDRVCLNYI